MTIQKIIVEPFSYGSMLIFFRERVPLHLKSKRYELTDKNLFRKHIYGRCKKHTRYVNLGTIVMIPSTGCELFLLSSPISKKWNYCILDTSKFQYNDYSAFTGNLKRLCILKDSPIISISICQDIVKQSYSAICSFENLERESGIQQEDNSPCVDRDECVDESGVDKPENVVPVEYENKNTLIKRWCIGEYIEIIRRYIQRIGTR